MKLSRYVKIIHLNSDSVVLYNSYNKAVIEVPKEALHNDYIGDDQYPEIEKILKEMDFFVLDEDVEKNLNKLILNREKLLISLEITLGCNLRCPYCYQADKNHISNLISNETIDTLIDYFEIVYQESPFKELDLKILGGEPTIAWGKFLYIYEKAQRFCKEHNVCFNILIDTNGILIDNILLLEGFDEMLLTIPLTYKECHDKVRKDVKGYGTYDKIIENLNRIYSSSKHITVNLRSNIDGENINYFDSYISDLKTKLKKRPLVSLNYTVEFDNKEQFSNGLTYNDFITWRSTEAIDILIKHGFPITVSPILTIEDCQFRSLYSMKVFSDGTCGHCAMSYFSEKRESLQNVVKTIVKKDIQYWGEKKAQSLLEDYECLKCSNLFVCGGALKLPCMKAIGISDCHNGFEHNVDLKSFFSRYCSCLEMGKADLFEMFNNGLRIR